MTWNNSFGWSEVVIATATLLGPVLAVQVQKYLERRRAQEQRRLQIFATLMATRATKLSPVHVEALNAIPVEFYGKGRDLAEIHEAWKEYLDHLEVVGGEAWSQKNHDLFIELLFRLSRYLGYKFSKLQLARDIYYPRGHGELEKDQEKIRRGLGEVLAGERVLPVAVVHLPQAEQSDEINSALLNWLSGNYAVKVEPVAETKGDESNKLPPPQPTPPTAADTPA